MRSSHCAAIFILCLLLCSIACRQDSEPGPSSFADGEFTASADGVPIYFNVQGEGDISLVFVHGWCADHTYWETQIPPFRVYYRVVTLDLAGHGRSGREREDWTINAFAQDVAAVVNQLKLDKAVLIGHALAGPVILETARLLPARVIGLVGADTFSDIYLQEYTPEQITAMLAIFQPDFAEGLRRYLLENNFRSNSTQSFKKKIILNMTKSPPEIALNAMENLLKYSGAETAAQLAIPVRSINSDLPVIPFKVIRDNCKDFKLRFMSNVGHFLMLENPEFFNQRLSGFLGEIIQLSYY